MKQPVLAAHRWKDNGQLINAAATLGYLDGSVLDCTYGVGTFWRDWTPDNFTACDADVSKSPLGEPVDATQLASVFGPLRFDVVVFDPPYKLNGTPDPIIDERYGVHVQATVDQRMQLIVDGLRQCCTVAKKRVLVKCMDQVVSGRKVWQTDIVTSTARDEGFRKRDRFDLLVTPRPQPSGRRQLHAQQNYSTLLVLERSKRTSDW